MKNRQAVLGCFLFIAIGILIFLKVDSLTSKRQVDKTLPDKKVSSIKQVEKPTVSVTKQANQAQPNTMVADINNVINSDPDGLSVAATVINLNTGEQDNAGVVGTIFKAASTAKVLTAVDYLHEVETGQASLTQSIDGTSAEQLMNQMIEVSDDNAWHDINNFLGNQLQTYADDIGLSSFTGSDYNTMTASDMAKLLYELYEGKLINNTYRTVLYNFMANTTSTNLIQAALPGSATVYHKYGQVWGYLNDAAIVESDNHNFVLVIYTNNGDGTTDEYDDQVDLMHKITEVVYQNIEDN